ncbi:hypothetical protein TNCV_3939921 [Trichonephila clavipes]|uniref:Uncharacterized protein n=1 Tax=Trichonephila clavipes TaxID=2585209 RepID=A0A8X7B8F4_TRICX|nr:hypothetical protein TNCV_3939921 [Trichonephila clavipes]
MHSVAESAIRDRSEAGVNPFLARKESVVSAIQSERQGGGPFTDSDGGKKGNDSKALFSFGWGLFRGLYSTVFFNSTYHLQQPFVGTVYSGVKNTKPGHLINAASFCLLMRAISHLAMILSAMNKDRETRFHPTNIRERDPCGGSSGMFMVEDIRLNGRTELLISK